MSDDGTIIADYRKRLDAAEHLFVALYATATPEQHVRIDKNLSTIRENRSLLDKVDALERAMAGFATPDGPRC